MKHMTVFIFYELIHKKGDIQYVGMHAVTHTHTHTNTYTPTLIQGCG